MDPIAGPRTKAVDIRLHPSSSTHAGPNLLVIALDLLRTALMLVVGYVAGSLPISAWVGRTAGVDVTREGEGNPDPAHVWELAGPGRGCSR